jgi:Exostosin family
VYQLEDRNASAAKAATWPGMRSAARQLGYASLQDYERDLQALLEPLMAMSTFCLTPPGDTPKRRGLIDAWSMGCVPVVFQEASRDLELFLLPEEGRNMSVLLAPEALLEGKDDELTAHLQAAAPPHKVRRMQAAALAKLTSLTWAYSDLHKKDHVKVGPDAWDMLLYQLEQRTSYHKARRGAGSVHMFG